MRTSFLEAIFSLTRTFDYESEFEGADVGALKEVLFPLEFDGNRRPYSSDLEGRRYFFSWTSILDARFPPPLS